MNGYVVIVLTLENGTVKEVNSTHGPFRSRHEASLTLGAISKQLIEDVKEAGFTGPRMNMDDWTGFYVITIDEGDEQLYYLVISEIS